MAETSEPTSTTTGKAPEPRALVYALGGGHGHAVRGSALAAALRRVGVEAKVLVPAERGTVAAALEAEAMLVDRPADGAALRETIAARLVEHDASVLVLDTFPEGLYGELLEADEGREPWASVRRIAVLRCRRDAAGARLAQGLSRCVHAVDLEPHLRWRPPELSATDFGPVVRPLSPAPVEVDVLLVGTEPALHGLTRKLASRLRARGLRVALVDPSGVHGLDHAVPSFPLPTSLLGARVVVGPAGFNLSYEVRALGGWHVALPRPRPFDDQARRARALAEHAESPPALERKVLQLLRTEPPHDRAPRVRPVAELAAHLRAAMV